MAIAAVAAATAMVGAVTVAVGWAVTASITGRPNIEIAMPGAPTLTAAVAEADDDDAPIYTGSLQVSDHRINVPHLKLALGFSIVAKNPMTPDLVVAKDPMPARFVLARVETPSRSVAARSPIAPPIEPPLPREASLGRADGPETPAERARPVAVASLAPVNIPPALPERPDPVPLPRTRPDIVGIKPALDEARIAPDPVQAAADARTAVYDIEARTVYLPAAAGSRRIPGWVRLMDDPRPAPADARRDAAQHLRAEAAGGDVPWRPRHPAQSGRRRQDVWPGRHPCPFLYARPERPVERLRLVQELFRIPSSVPSRARSTVWSWSRASRPRWPHGFEFDRPVGTPSTARYRQAQFPPATQSAA